MQRHLLYEGEKPQVMVVCYQDAVNASNSCLL
jgi:hypothetical protein